MEFDNICTLSSDLDGVINEKRNNDYINNWEEFALIKGALEAILLLSSIFDKTFIIKNRFTFSSIEKNDF